MEEAHLSLHRIWKGVRGPFYRFCCGDAHSWERYDSELAGCTACGVQHKCNGATKCPLQTQDDCAVVCTITGLLVSTICCAKEYSEHCQTSETPGERRQKTQHQFSINVYDVVLRVVQDILHSERTTHARIREFEEKLNQSELVFIRFIKEFKMNHPVETRLCIPDAFAFMLFMGKLQVRQNALEHLPVRCASIITRCIHDLARTNKNYHQFSTRQFIVGLLYLMRHGLMVEHHIWLPKVSILECSLPQENQLRKMFQLSPKIICETENEVKRLLRERIGKY